MSTPELLFMTPRQGLFELVGDVCRRIGARGYSSETYKGINRVDLTNFIRGQALTHNVIPFTQMVTTIQAFIPDRLVGKGEDDQARIVYGRRSTIIALSSNLYGEVLSGPGCANIAFELMKELGLDRSQAQQTRFRGF